MKSKLKLSPNLIAVSQISREVTQGVVDSRNIVRENLRKVEKANASLGKSWKIEEHITSYHVRMLDI